METIGRKIAAARNLAGFTQRRLALEVNIDQHLISDYENDKKSPTLEHLENISTVLKVPIVVANKTDDENLKMIDYLINKIVALKIEVNELSQKGKSAS